ncbi:MAG TPA: helix-turn-helix domain-containing protein [Solirubrobacteraceae bacterium]|nr:helix-turn-helix domain-containing protein [Solirubrobacteraceae bacterium]
MEPDLVKIEQDPAFARPWESLDPELADVLLPELAGLADEILGALRANIPEYHRPMQGVFGATVRNAIEEALRQFVDQMGPPHPPTHPATAPAARPGRSVYVELGRGELRAGRRLDALQAAYRLGARISWRRLAGVARGAGVDPDQLSLLAESIFAYIDELSAESVEGYAREQAAHASERQGRRQHLVRLLVEGAPADELDQAAATASWKLPRTLAVLACDYFDAERLAARVGDGAIAVPLDGCCCMLIPDPDAPGRREALSTALRRTTGAIGPSVPPAQAGRSFARARACLRLQVAGMLPHGGLVIADDRLVTLILHRDPQLLDELAGRCLAPLDGLTPAAADRLLATLGAWLRCQGSVPDVAAALHVHPQTVRYRLARLREHFGTALDDPDARFELELATRARRPAPTP